MSLVLTAVLTISALAAGCNDGRTPITPGTPTTDAGGGTGDGSMPGTDGSMPGTDGSMPGDDGGGTPGGDGGIPGTDAGPGGSGMCDPVCLMQSGAMCCTACGCGGASVRCEPQCDVGARWDCELGCCFDTTTFMCQ